MSHTASFQVSKEFPAVICMKHDVSRNQVHDKVPRPSDEGSSPRPREYFNFTNASGLKSAAFAKSLQVLERQKKLLGPSVSSGTMHMLKKISTYTAISLISRLIWTPGTQ